MSTFHKAATWGLTLILITLVACQTTPVAPTLTVLPSPTPATSEVSSHIPATEDAVPRTTVDELKAKLDAGEDVVIVDTRSLAEFNERHIAGAISMPLGEVDSRYKELPKDKPIVLYCT